jgi:hypothetical protein
MLIEKSRETWRGVASQLLLIVEYLTQESVHLYDLDHSKKTIKVIRG